ncbi:hypothetical protein L6452_00153 [Arctium lappa]|uniref:Uncharacterized protein n=1 Tax=Arctium lappa TaxID=4217 RepID=A0ACB9FDC6_ARCLA|nr:hypothetical protein L6452_00153 [Arctium lappa]
MELFKQTCTIYTKSCSCLLYFCNQIIERIFEIYSVIRKRKNVNGDWIDDKIESWVDKPSTITPKEPDSVNNIEEKKILFVT